MTASIKEIERAALAWLAQVNDPDGLSPGETPRTVGVG